MSNDQDEWQQALDDAKEWFGDHGAASVVANLRAGATEDQLRAVETKLGTPLPASLRWLYARHDGQAAREANPFFEDLVFCDLAYAMQLRDGMLVAYFRPPRFVDPATPLRDAELTERWFPLANTSHAFLAVNLDSGRVVLAQKDSPAIRVVADSVGELLYAYASALYGGTYRIAGDPSLDGVKHEGIAWLERYAEPRGESFRL